MYHEMLVFYGEELTVLCPVPKAIGLPMLAVCNCSCIIYTVIPSMSTDQLLHLQPQDPSCRGYRPPTATMMKDYISHVSRWKFRINIISAS